MRPVALLVFLLVAAHSGAQSLRFFGYGLEDVDRVKISIDDPETPADLGLDFTIEFWMKTEPGDAPVKRCDAGAHDSWIDGNIIVDRDIYGRGDYGDFGISQFADGLSFGVAIEFDELTICSGENLADGRWHHVAATRAATGEMTIYVDGRLAASGDGPKGDASYRDGRETRWPNSDPYLVLGAEKHDAGPEYPSYSGWLDEVRLSSIVRYTGSDFPVPGAPFLLDDDTLALYHFDEGSGDVVTDATLGSRSPGVRQFGGAPNRGPQWSDDSPFAKGSSPGTIRFLHSNYLVSRGVVSFVIGVQRAGGVKGNVSVTYSTQSVDGSVSPIEAGGVLSWDDQDSSVRPIHLEGTGQIAQGGGDVLIVLSEPEGGAVLGSQSTTRVRFCEQGKEPVPQSHDHEQKLLGGDRHVFAVAVGLLLLVAVVYLLSVLRKS